MKLAVLPQRLTVCKVARIADLDLSREFYFIGRTDGEISLVCETAQTPPDAVAREDGWRGLRVQGTLDFSLVGVLSGLTGILAERGIGLFAVSTYDTDYILVKAENLDRAVCALREKGYAVEALN